MDRFINDSQFFRRLNFTNYSDYELWESELSNSNVSLFLPNETNREEIEGYLSAITNYYDQSFRFDSLNKEFLEDLINGLNVFECYSELRNALILGLQYQFSQNSVNGRLSLRQNEVVDLLKSEIKIEITLLETIIANDASYLFGRFLESNQYLDSLVEDAYYFIAKHDADNCYLEIRTNFLQDDNDKRFFKTICKHDSLKCFELYKLTVTEDIWVILAENASINILLALFPNMRDSDIRWLLTVGLIKAAKSPKINRYIEFIDEIAKSGTFNIMVDEKVTVEFAFACNAIQYQNEAAFKYFLSKLKRGHVQNLELTSFLLSYLKMSKLNAWYDLLVEMMSEPIEPEYVPMQQEYVPMQQEYVPVMKPFSPVKSLKNGKNAEISNDVYLELSKPENISQLENFLNSKTSNKSRANLLFVLCALNLNGKGIKLIASNYLIYDFTRDEAVRLYSESNFKQKAAAIKFLQNPENVRIEVNNKEKDRFMKKFSEFY